MLHICDFRVHMQNKYIRLQICCDFSVRIQILQLQVLKTSATIMPSYERDFRQNINIAQNTPVLQYYGIIVNPEYTTTGAHASV